jgi:flagellar basal-body rod modification protein FlgD
MVTSAVASPAFASGNKLKSSNKLALKTEDFIRMMITQLQQQDPMEPAKNEQLLAQMSQIGQLQSNTQLQESLKGMVLQHQIGSAGNLIGKAVKGITPEGDPVQGLVNSVRVEEGTVKLELDNGQALALDRVTSIGGAAAPAPAAAAT